MGLVLSVARVYDVDGAAVPARVTPDVFVLDDLLRLAQGHDDPLDVALRRARAAVPLARQTGARVPVQIIQQSSDLAARLRMM
jgi:hypothetical protein